MKNLIDLFTQSKSPHVCVNSKEVKPGSIFFALKGEKTDGHQFIDQAIAQGAIAAVIESDCKEIRNKAPKNFLFFDVKDSLKALQSLSRDVLSERKAKIIAITGSVGKTTTKDFTHQLLSQKYKVAKTFANYNSQIGLPLTLLNHTKGNEEFLVLEMGMSGHLHIQNLVSIAPPDLAVLTSVTYAHAEKFSSLEAISDAKAEILSHPHTKKAYLSYELPFLSKLAQIGKSKKLTYSIENEKADYFLKPLEKDQIAIYEKGNGNPVLARSKLPLHHLNNLLVACMIAREYDLSWDLIKTQIPLLTLPEKRFEIVEKKGITFINDSYNASLLSIKGALESLPSPRRKGRKIAVLGAMVELGSFSTSCHEEVALFALDKVDEILCLDKECTPILNIWQKEKRPCTLFKNFDTLKLALEKIAKPDDVVLIKGANKYKLWELL